MTKTIKLAALLTAATMTMAGAAWAVDAQPAAKAEPTVPPITAEVNMQPTVPMADAVKTAEEAYQAKTHRANLRRSAQYGLVWDVRMLRDDNTCVRALVDAKTGKVLAADVKGIQERRGPRGMGPGAGMGPGYGPHCPLNGESRPHHRGGHHGYWH